MRAHPLPDRFERLTPHGSLTIHTAVIATTLRPSREKGLLFGGVDRCLGLAHRDPSGVTSIGIDEILWQRGHKYLTVAYQIDRHCKRLLWVGKDRTLKTLLRFFREFGKEQSTLLLFVCSDRWKPYLTVIAKKASQAIFSRRISSSSGSMSPPSGREGSWTAGIAGRCVRESSQ